MEEGLYFLSNQKIQQEQLDLILGDDFAGELQIYSYKDALKSLKNEYSNFFEDMAVSEVDVVQEYNLKDLNPKSFDEVISQTKTVIFTDLGRSLIDLEMAFDESIERTERLHEALKLIMPLAFIEIWDASAFWSGDSFMQWFERRLKNDEE